MIRTEQTNVPSFHTVVTGLFRAPGERRLSYDDLGYPWRGLPTPRAAAIEASTARWVVERGLVSEDELARRFTPVNVGLLTCMAFPHATFERQELLSHLLGWIFLKDDLLDEAIEAHDPDRLEALFDGYLRVLQGQPAPVRASASVRALEELSDRIARLADFDWFDWFCDSMRDFWMEGLVGEARLKHLDGVADAETYMRMRTYSIGVLPFLDLVELSQEFALPRIVVAQPHLQQLRWLAARIIAYANDVFSFEKERRAGDPNNYVWVLMQHEGLDVAEAVDRTIRVHDRELQAFERLARAAPDVGPLDEQVRRYIDGHREWMRGALDWQLVSRRYAPGRALLTGAEVEGEQ